ncbi:hypothetical protein ACJIZ3_007630 [Penstemon smallii]|uniref:DC1 domain-containing protein n=1 Tax=Penstemon smallii TaxID=265156 RepID=A0ABD3T7H9_9LAMI
MKHFSHPHELSSLSMVSNENKEISCCRGCNFYLHKLCFDFPQSIQSKSHPIHSLGLLYPPYCKGDCDACGESCNGFTYNCNICNYNIHANCSNLLESKPEDDCAHYFKKFMENKLSKLKLLSATNYVGSNSTSTRASKEKEELEKYEEEKELLRQQEMKNELSAMRSTEEL